MKDASRSIELLHSYGVLDSSILISHATNIDADEAALLLESNSHVSATPSSEMQMCHGDPVAFQANLGIESQCSLGIDCHSNNSASIPGQMNILLQHARSNYNQKFIDKGKQPRHMYKTVEDVFNLGTINGARAINMQHKIGSLAVGKLADIVVFDASSPSMVCAAEHDPIAAVVQHSSPKDVEMVIVDGIVRKRDGRLAGVDVKAGRELWAGEKRDFVEWADVAKELVRRRKALQEKLDKIDFEEARRGVIKAFHIDETTIVEKI